MGILKNADDSPAFTTGDPLSPTALNILRDNVLALDEATRLGGYAFCGLYGQHPEENGVQQWVIWRGGFVFLSGMATLRVITSTSGTVGGAVLRIYRGDNGANDSLPGTYNDVALSAGTQTHSITISGAGYAHQQIVRVQIELRHASPPGSPYSAAIVDVLLVEALSVTLSAPAWPGLPTFGSAAAITAVNLNQLSDAIDWLIARCALRYDPLTILHIRRVGPFRDTDGATDQNVRWYGGVRRSPLHTTLTARGRVMVRWGGATEQIQLWANGIQVASSGVATAVGEYPWELTHSLTGYADGQVVPLQIRFVRTAPSLSGSPVNRWTVNDVFAATPTGGASTLAAWQVRQAAVSDAAIVSWLTTLRTIAQACYDRIAANTAYWGVQRAFTARPASGNENFRIFEPWGMPATWRRTGEALVGRGRGLTIGYGAGYFDEAAFAKEAQGIGGIGAYPVKNNKTATFIDGDNVESGRLYLDTVPGLPVGAAYNVRGEESYYLAEQLKVVD